MESGVTGYVIGIIGIALCVLACGIGSAIGLFKTGSAAAGVLGENPKKFGKVLVLVLHYRHNRFKLVGRCLDCRGRLGDFRRGNAYGYLRSRNRYLAGQVGG